MGSNQPPESLRSNNEHVSVLVSLIYEAVLTPNLSTGLTERTSNSNFAALQGSPLDQILDTALVSQTLPHLDHALTLAAKQQPASSRANAGILFSDLPLPVCIISKQLELLSTNDRAQIMLHTSVDLPLNATQAFNFKDSLKDELLHAVGAAIHSQCTRVLNCTVDSGMAQTILVIPTPNKDGAQTSIRSPAAEIVFLNFESGIEELTTALVEIYKLTKSEAGVTALLAQGYSLAKIAEIKNCSINTVRTQIKTTYRKTGTCRQGQLISLALNGPAVWLNIVNNSNKKWQESSAYINRAEDTIELNDGRQLGYGDYGPKDGKPVILSHHLMGSRKEKPDNESFHMRVQNVRKIIELKVLNERIL